MKQSLTAESRARVRLAGDAPFGCEWPVWLCLLIASACAGGPPHPAALAVGQDTCANCRMVVSNARYSAQLVALGEEPKFFDDIGCLAAYLTHHPPLPDTVAFVADHRTSAWVLASRAVYTRIGSADTPMGSHVMAHLDAASRDNDRDARSGAPVGPTAVFGPARLPEGAR